jgi:outer membrane usher protein
VPFVRPYHENNLSLDEQQVSGAEIDNIAKTVVPTRNAIVKVKYDTWIGYKAMITCVLIIKRCLLAPLLH